MNASLDTPVQYLSNKFYQQKCKHCLKCKDCKKCKDDAVELCKKGENVKNCQIIVKNAKTYLTIVAVILNTKK